MLKQLAADGGTALSVPRWALAFSRRHAAVLLGLSAVPAVERFTGQLWARDPATGLALEGVTTAARVLFVVVVVRLTLLREPGAAGVGAREAGRRVASFARRRPAALLAQFALVGALFVLADVVPEQVVPALAPVGPLYWGALLGIKNLTVIPFTVVWLVAVLRQALLDTDVAGERDRAPRVDVPRG